MDIPLVVIRICICHEKMSSITEMSVDDAVISQLLFEFFVLIYLFVVFVMSEWSKDKNHQPPTPHTNHL